VQFKCIDVALKVTTDFTDDICFLLALRVKLTVNADILYIPVKMTFSMFIVPNSPRSAFLIVVLHSIH